MEANEPVDPDYIKGFNEGYTMKKHAPELADKIAEALGDKEHGTGFKDGREQFILELEKERYPKWLRNDRLSSLDEQEAKQRELDKDKNKEDREPERDR